MLFCGCAQGRGSAFGQSRALPLRSIGGIAEFPGVHTGRLYIYIISQKSHNTVEFISNITKTINFE